MEQVSASQPKRGRPTTTEYNKKSVRCPTCRGTNIGVTDSRPVTFEADTVTRRRRLCADCGHAWHTLELTEDTFTDWRSRLKVQLLADIVRQLDVKIGDLFAALAKREDKS